MSFVKELLKLVYKKYPILDDSHHLVTYDRSTDQLTLLLSAYGTLIPIGLTDDELEKEPKEVMDSIVDVIEEFLNK